MHIHFIKNTILKCNQMMKLRVKKRIVKLKKRKNLFCLLIIFDNLKIMTNNYDMFGIGDENLEDQIDPPLTSSGLHR